MVAPVAADSAAETYRLRAKLPVYRARVDRARMLIYEAVAKGECYVGFSGGKDSLALLHLVQSVDQGIPGFFIDSGAETPDTLDTVQSMESRGHLVERIYPLRSIIEMFKLVGLLGYDGPDRLPGEWHWKRNKWKQVLIDEPAARIRSLGYEVALLGLRKDENKGRGISLRKYGPVHRRKDGVWIACPLADWTGADVLAYCMAHDLPLSKIYLDPGDSAAEREHRRTGTALGSTYTSYGRLQDLRRRYPKMWAELVADFPRIVDLA